MLILCGIIVFKTLLIGVIDAGTAPGHKEASEKEEETKEIPLGLEEWTAEGTV